MNPKGPAGEMDGKTWLRYSISVWNDIKKSAAEQKTQHPALFPGMLVQRLLKIFTREGELVLDPFLGSGSTLVEAANLGRNGLGLEISGEYVALARRRLEQRQLSLDNVGSPSSEIRLTVHHADARRLKEYLGAESADFCLTSPPYWNILSRKRTADGKEIKDYGNAESDLSLLGDYRRFTGELKVVFEQVYHVLKPWKYCVVIVMDIRKGSDFYPLHMDLSNCLSEAGFVLDDIIIWDRRSEYNSLRPLGYPYVFRVNKVHEYIMIFQKRV